MKGHQALRRGRRSLPGHVYLLTTATAGRRALFADPISAFAACRAIHASSRGSPTQCLAWVLMPDHWHGLVQLGESDSLPRFMNALKSRVSKAVRTECASLRPIWQPGYHDRALRKDEDVLAAARYIVRNPVRAGLVARTGDYPYWNARWL
jgi:REP element-mobilizing transposase RayT